MGASQIAMSTDKEAGLILQQENIDDCDMRLVEKAVDPEVFTVGLVLNLEDCERYLGRKEHEYEDMRDLEVPNAAIYLCRGDQRPLVLQNLSVDDSRGISRDEDEDFRGVGKCDRVHRYIRQDVIRNVVDEDEKK